MCVLVLKYGSSYAQVITGITTVLYEELNRQALNSDGNCYNDISVEGAYC